MNSLRRFEARPHDDEIDRRRYMASQRNVADVLRTFVLREECSFCGMPILSCLFRTAAGGRQTLATSFLLG